jgi:hypothetical protein
MKIKLGLMVVLVSIFFSINSVVFAQNGSNKISVEKEIQIKKLLMLTGSAQLGNQVVEQLLTNFEKALPQVPKEFWQGFKNEFKSDELINRLLPIYDKYISLEDLTELIKFYESPAFAGSTTSEPRSIDHWSAIWTRDL